MVFQVDPSVSEWQQTLAQEVALVNCRLRPCGGRHSDLYRLRRGLNGNRREPKGGPSELNAHVAAGGWAPFKAPGQLPIAGVRHSPGRRGQRMGQTRTPSTAARLPEAASTRVRTLRSCSRLQLGGCCIFTENRWWSPCLRCVFSASGTLLGRPQRQVPLRRCALRRGRGCKQGRPCIAQVGSWRLDSDQGDPATPSPASQPVSRLRLNGARGAWHSACLGVPPPFSC